MGKAKDGSECYTRQNKSGGSYVTCEGTQKKRAARSKLKAGGEPPVLTKSIPPNSARARGRRSAAARKLTTRPEAAGRIETGIINPGVVMPEGASASFEGLFGSVAPEPVEDDQDINEDILSEVIPGLFEGMGSGVPVGDRPVYAGDFLDVLNVISDRSAQRETDKQEIFAKYEPYSIGQLSTAYRKHFKANNPGYVTSVPKYISKEGIIKWIVKSGMPDSYLPKSGRKEPKTKWYLQGWILDDDDDDSVLVGGLESYGFELEETYPNGSAQATAMLTKQELLKFVTNERENFEDYTDLYNLYTDSRGYRGKGMVWEGLK